MESTRMKFLKDHQKQNHTILEPTSRPPTHLPITNHVNLIIVTLQRPQMVNQKPKRMIRSHR